MNKKERKKLLKKFKNYTYSRTNESILASGFLLDARKSFLEGLFVATVMYSTQAVEIALLLEIVNKYEEEKRIDEYKKRCWRGSKKGGRYVPPAFGGLINTLEKELKDSDVWVLDTEYVRKAKELKKLRNTYVHYVNYYFYTSRFSGEKSFTDRVERLTQEILPSNIDEKILKRGSKIGLKPLEPKRKRLQRIFEPINRLRWLEDKEITDFFTQRRDRFIVKQFSKVRLVKILLGFHLRLLVSKLGIKIKTLPPETKIFEQKDAIDSITLSFEILEYLGYVNKIE